MDSSHGIVRPGNATFCETLGNYDIKALLNVHFTSFRVSCYMITAWQHVVTGTTERLDSFSKGAWHFEVDIIPLEIRDI